MKKTSVGVPIAPVVVSLVVLFVTTGLSVVAEDDGNTNAAIRLPTDITGLLADLPTATARGEKERPWKCCDMAVCTRSYPPFCWCMDRLDRCSDACKSCTKTTEDSDEGYICRDRYHGDPGPRCAEDDGAGKHVAAAWNEDDDNDDKPSRPWKCCDLQACTRSQPPTCRCRDVVKKCAKTCKRCEKVEGSSDSDNHTRYRCLDTYHGDPAPPCRRHGGTMTRRAVLDAILRGYGY